ncbi:MFS transporter [Paenibacillus herberti]|uniref:MFS transporter n=1 Tax=Paenibacillus herberti TaxID=1619309 RepID=A0A229NT84_9BACL|nr:MFS transporter [Paenibacillus herberti]OXM13090.1 MFS transporter [Paenibacillus herberti]
MKTAIWLYLFLFVAMFDLHAQYPILTPFAVSLGAAPSFIGLMMGLYSITHLPGNLIAGFSIDRFGSRIFIALSLLGAGLILLLQAQVTNPWQLLVLRSISGFVLAFLSPACSALLARMATNAVQQGRLMSGSGFVHTLASVVSPAAGAFLVASIGFTSAFYLLGWVLIVTAICAILFVRDPQTDGMANPASPPGSAGSVSSENSAGSANSAPQGAGQQGSSPGSAGFAEEEQEQDRFPWLLYALPVAISCSQGILSFELPLMSTSTEGMMRTGLLFSVVSLGGLITLSMLFLNRVPAFTRTLWGALMLAAVYYGIATEAPLPLVYMLLGVGMAKGIIFPALSTLLIELSSRARYGRTFSLLSIAFSVGAFLGPMIAGQVRDFISPYFISFFVLMLAAAILPLHGGRRRAGSATAQLR